MKNLDLLKRKIKEEYNITDLLTQRGITLKTVGTGKYKCCCPFHSEKTPSCFVDETYQNYKCFGCGESGDVITFIMNIEGLNYIDALIYLAKEKNIETEEYKIDEEYKDLRLYYEIMNEAYLFYQNEYINLKEEHPCKQIVKSRNLDINNNEYYGYANERGKDLYNYLTKKGYNKKDLLELRLINDKGYDFFRDRLLFPIRNYIGKIVGFTARQINKNDNFGKYINTPQTQIYNKSNILYNLDRAKQDIFKKNIVYVVEGTFDVISMIENNYHNTVASCGTAFTENHSRELLKVINNYGKIIFCMDGDSAGIKSMLGIFEKYPILHENAYIIQLPNNQDPCDYFLENTELPKCKPMLEYVFDYYTTINTSTNVGSFEKIEYIKKIQEQFLKFIKKGIIRNNYIKKIADYCEFEFEEVNKMLTIKDVDKIKEIITSKQKKLSEEDDFLLASISLHLQLFTYTHELFNVEEYPKKYSNFLNSLNAIMEKNNDKFKIIVEDLEIKKHQNMLRYIIENYEYNVDESNLDILKEHLIYLKEQAKDIINKEKDNLKIKNIIQNIHGKTTQEIIEILRMES